MKNMRNRVIAIAATALALAGVAANPASAAGVPFPS